MKGWLDSAATVLGWALVILLQGCANPLKADPLAVLDHSETWRYNRTAEAKTISIERHDKAGLRKACKVGISCFEQKGSHFILHFGPEADTCAIAHELAHAMGWRHDGPNSSCGPVLLKDEWKSRGRT